MSGVDNRQLRELLDAAVGDPPHRVTVAAVRRRLVRRRVTEAVTVAAAVVALTGLGVAVAVQASRAIPGPTSTPRHPAATSRHDAPRYYVQQSFGGGGRPPQPVVRATATGAVTATVRCPWPGAVVADQGIAATRSQTFFMVCEKVAKNGENYVITGSQIYRLQLTGSGRIGGYFLIPGGLLGRHTLDDITATLDGSEIAVTVGPGTIGAVKPGPSEVFVINTQTGARATWRSGAKVLSAGSLTFTDHGRELEFVGLTPCGRQGKSTCRQLRAISPATTGGQLDRSRLLLPLSALSQSPADYINDVLISPDGSTLIAGVVRSNSPRSSAAVLVIRYSATTGRQLRVLYQLRTGNGFSYHFVSSDPTRRYLLFNAGPTTGTVNGWIDHGRLIPLKPANGSNILYETW